MADPELSNKIRRWDDIRRNQFGLALTTFTALATGGVGYCAKLIADEKVHFSSWASFWFLLAAIAFGVGLLVGVFTTWTRLRDSRLTAQKLHRRNEGASPGEISQITAKSRCWESATWFLFHTLVVCVSVGIISITCCIGVMYHGKLSFERLGAPDGSAAPAQSKVPVLHANTTNAP